MLRHYTCTSFLAAALFGLGPAAIANTGDSRDHGSRAEDRLVREFAHFAGSKHNAEALVEGLRDDKTVRLTSKNDSATFNPATGKMGFGNVDIALSLAQATLADHGIRKPTPDDIKAALNGGTITTKSGERITLPGVLKLRASGKGWGEIAHRLGLKLGEVMRHRHHHHHFAQHKHHDHKHADMKHDHKHADWKHDHKHADWKHDWGRDRDRADWNRDRGDFKQARFDRPARPEKLDRPERAERAERPERPHRK